MIKYIGSFFRVFVITTVIGGFLAVAVGGFENTKTDSNYLQGLGTNPADTNLRFGFALQLLSNKRDELAQQQLEIAYQFDKKNVYVGSALSRLLINSQGVRTEIDRTLQIIVNRPDYASAWFRLASLYETIEETEKANLAKQTGEQLRTI